MRKLLLALIISFVGLLPVHAQWTPPPPSGGGSGTVDSGTSGQIGYYGSSGTTISGNANATIVGGQLTLGQSSGPVNGTIVLYGATSGTVTLGTPAVAGTGTIFNFPPNDGTNTYFLQTDGSGNTSWVAAPGTGTLTSFIVGAGASSFLHPSVAVTSGAVTLTGNGTKGDMPYLSASNTISNLGIGSTNQILTIVSGIPAWTTNAYPATSSQGDILYADLANTITGLAIGSSGKVLTSSGTVPQWSLGSTVVTNGLPLTNKGDLLYENATPAPAALAIGTTGQVLTVVGGVPAWANASGGVSSFTGDGTFLSNSASTGAVTATLASAAANTVWGNNTGSSGAPSYTNAPSVVSLALNGNTTLVIPTYSGGTPDTSSLSIGVGTPSTVGGNGYSNLYVGAQAGAPITNGYYNAIIGAYACQLSGNINFTTALGYTALQRVTGSSNIGIGYGAGSNTLRSGASNILIGNSVDVPASSTSDYLNIGNAIYASGIYGGTTYVGINQSAPAYPLDVNGAAQAAVIFNSAAVTTIAGSSSGNFYWSQPEQGSGYKKVVVVLSGVTDAGTTITFTTAFAHTPSYVLGSGITITPTSVSTTQIVLPATAAQTGVITVEGI